MSSERDMPVGFKFCPSEEEVIDHFLRLKRQGMDSEVDPYIAEVDFCMWDPWELPCKSKVKSNENEWWFSSRPHYYKNSNRRRKTKNGTWKVTGPEKQIKGCINGGMKRFLTFYRCRTALKPERTDWVIHEYYYPEPDIPLHHQKPTCVICCLKYDPRKKARKADTPEPEEGEPSGEIMSDLEIPVAPLVTPEVQHHDEVNPQSLCQQPLYSPDSNFSEQTLSFLHENSMQAPFGADEEAFPDWIVVSPEENNLGKTEDNLINSSYLRDSSKWSYLDDPVSSERDIIEVDERCIQTWKVQAHLVHLFARRKSSIRKWLKHQVKLYKLVLVKIPCKKQLFPLVTRFPKRVLPLATQLHMWGEISCLNLVTEEYRHVSVSE